MTQKAVLIGIDGAQLEKLYLLSLRDEATEITDLDIVETFTGGFTGTGTEQDTSSGPGWSTLLTGVWVDQHGIPNNSGQPINAEIDSLFERVDAGIEDAVIASVVNWAPINEQYFAREAGLLDEPAVIDFVISGLPDADVAATTADLITTEGPDFTFVQLDETDAVGDALGFGEEYDQALIKAAAEVGQIIDAVEAREAANPDEDWIVLISTDSGRDGALGLRDGGQEPSQKRTFIASTEPLAVFDAPVPATSAAPTVLDHLGIPFELGQLETGSLLDGAQDPLPPVLEEIVSPANGETFVALDTDLVATFSEPLAIGAGSVRLIDAATGTEVQSVDIASDAVALAGDTLTVDLPENLDPGTRYIVNIDAGAVTDLPTAALGAVYFEEDFEGLVDDLGPFVSETEAGGDGTDWTATLPEGWSQENNTPTGGPAEFFGWTFLDVNSWIATEDDQRRAEFVNAGGVVAVADPDAYDDGATDIDPDLFDAALSTPAIDISAAPAGSLVLAFDSSWRDEDAQEAAITVAYDGGEAIEILRWSSDPESPNFKDDAPNERILLPLENPEGASSLEITFDMPQGGNDWWWALDDIVVAESETGLVTNDFRGISDTETWSFTTDEAAALNNLFFEDWESLADELGPWVSPSESGGDGTDWTNTLPEGWSVLNNTPEGGPVEFFGWTFVDVNSWTVTAGDQRRSEFTNATNVVAVADPDEYDDGDISISPDLFDAALVSPEIDIAGVDAGRLRLTFDSSWRPEDTQEVRLLAAYDGAEPVELLNWSSDPASPNFKDVATNETLILDLDNPAGAETVQFTFDMPVAGNDWWWAVDNLSVDEVVPAADTVLLFAEDWESLADDLGPLVSDTETGGDGTDWTAAAPQGWTVSTGTTPAGGPAEFFGWTFFDLGTWVTTAEDQDRGGFTNAAGVVAVADPDEYDDGATDIDPDLYNTTLTSPEIDVSGVGAGPITISFDSSWRPEDAQAAAFSVRYETPNLQVLDELFAWSSDPASPDFKPDAVNERISLSYDLPDGVDAISLVFDMPQGGNDWWWAVDNITVEGPAAAAERVTLLTEDFEGLPLQPFESATETGGDGTDWTAVAPQGWTADPGTTPTGGPAEFFGWTFLDLGAWIATEEDQDRAGFTNAAGTVAVADPDAYDDGATDVDPDLFEAFLSAPEIDLTGIAANSLRVEFDSSWRPEDAQEARLVVSYDGGEPVELLRWTSDPADADFKPDAVNEALSFDLANPAGAESAVITWEMPAGGNDWWWAIDNVAVTGLAVGDGLGQGLSEEAARTVVYLYETGLDRDGNIDTDGANFWIDQREAGLSELQLAGAFLNADEFQETAEAFLGDGTDLTDANIRDAAVFSDDDYVEFLFQNTFDRASDAAGFEFWSGQLDTLRANPETADTARETLLLAFATSDENTEQLTFVQDFEEVAPGEWDFVTT